MRNRNSRYYALAVACLLAVSLLLSGCSTVDKQSGRLSQVSLLNALLLGEYDGFVTVETLKQQGNLGIGTFDTLDGEMILLDGIVYQAKADGTVHSVADSVLVPFAMATNFSDDVTSSSLPALAGIEALKAELDRVIADTTNDFNRFYAARVEGSFNHIRVRSVPAQPKPYKRLADIAPSQKEYAFDSLEGTIVAFRCPSYVQGMNMPGWHLHFLSSDATKGGHLLEVDLQQAKLDMGGMREYFLLLPDSKSFSSMDIAHDLSQETQAIEGVMQQ